MRRALLLTLWPLAAATPAHAAAAVCPPPAEAVEAAPTAEPGEVTIACAGSTPIFEATFKHWKQVAAGPSQPPPSDHELVSEVMGFLLLAAWVRGEAKVLHVRVSPAAVRRKFNRIRDEFPRRRDFRRFLKNSKETVADMMWFVEFRLLSERIERRVTAGHRGAKAKLEAERRFMAHFRKKWTAQTYCAPAYAVKDCGHVQANL